MNENLSIRLSSDISYIYGLVNGEVATFSLTGPGVWSATVPKATDGKYKLSITAYNNAGTSITYNATVYKLEGLIKPKFDWTKDDFYNPEDFNRIEANTQYLAEYLRSLDYVIPNLEANVNRDNNSMEFLKSINRIENNINILTNYFIVPPGFLGSKVWKPLIKFDYEDANRLEENIYLLDKWARNTKESFIYCGTLNCGGEVI